MQSRDLQPIGQTAILCKLCIAIASANWYLLAVVMASRLLTHSTRVFDSSTQVLLHPKKLVLFPAWDTKLSAFLSTMALDYIPIALLSGRDSTFLSLLCHNCALTRSCTHKCALCHIIYVSGDQIQSSDWLEVT